MPWPVFLHVPQRPDVVRQNAAVVLAAAAAAAGAAALRVLRAHPPRVQDLPDLRAQRLHHDVVPDRPVLKLESTMYRVGRVSDDSEEENEEKISTPL